MSSIPSVEEEACRMMWGVEGGIGEEGTPVLREMPSIVHHLWLVRWTEYVVCLMVRMIISAQLRAENTIHTGVHYLEPLSQTDMFCVAITHRFCSLHPL